jgi:uncharacterized protein DUF4926
MVLAAVLPKDSLRAGDVGVIVEHYPARADVPEGYELEVFAETDQTIAVVSVPASAVRRRSTRSWASGKWRGPDCPRTVPLLGPHWANVGRNRRGLSWLQLGIDWVRIVRRRWLVLGSNPT